MPSVREETILKDYRENIIRILHAYQPGSEGLMKAIEALCRTAEEMGIRAGRDAAAADVCEGLHLQPAKGLKCRLCYQVEQGFSQTEAVEAEYEAVKKEKEQG